MKTRRQEEGSPLRQERYASHPDLQTALNGGLVAKRCAGLEDPALVAAIWFVQQQSLLPVGFKKLAATLLQEQNQASQDALISELQDMCLNPDWIASIPCIPEGYCLSQPGRTKKTNWFERLVIYQEQIRSSARSSLAQTEVVTSIWKTLDFCLARRRLVRIEGVSGIGKTHATKAWCQAQTGTARYVEVPSSNDDRSFYVAIAESLGIARGAAFNTQQVKLRVEEALRVSGLMLVMDEAQFLIPQYIRPRGTPARLQWLKTAFDADIPIALISLPDFTKWQNHYVKVTMWSDEQFERRTNRKITLPGDLSDTDLLAIAQNLHPTGDGRSWMLLAGYARAAVKRNASGISEALESAAYLASLDGRKSPQFSDIERALEDYHFPSDKLPSLKPKQARPSVTTPPKSFANPFSRTIREPLATVPRSSLKVPM